MTPRTARCVRRVDGGLHRLRDVAPRVRVLPEPGEDEQAVVDGEAEAVRRHDVHQVDRHRGDGRDRAEDGQRRDHRQTGNDERERRGDRAAGHEHEQDQGDGRGHELGLLQVGLGARPTSAWTWAGPAAWMRSGPASPRSVGTSVPARTAACSSSPARASRPFRDRRVAGRPTVQYDSTARTPGCPAAACVSRRPASATPAESTGWSDPATRIRLGLADGEVPDQGGGSRGRLRGRVVEPAVGELALNPSAEDPGDGCDDQRHDHDG